MTIGVNHWLYLLQAESRWICFCKWWQQTLLLCWRLEIYVRRLTPTQSDVHLKNCICFLRCLFLRDPCWPPNSNPPHAQRSVTRRWRLSATERLSDSANETTRVGSSPRLWSRLSSFNRQQKCALRRGIPPLSAETHHISYIKEHSSVAPLREWALVELMSGN